VVVAAEVILAVVVVLVDFLLVLVILSHQEHRIQLLWVLGVVGPLRRQIK